MTRKEKLLTGIDLKKPGLELGPLCWPVVTKQEANIHYVDHLTTQELKKKYVDEQLAFDKIVEVDYVLKQKTLAAAVGQKKFDYIIASHVMEHLPNLVGWLQEVAAVLRPGGILSLAIPDKRFTFDIDRNESRPADALGAYLDNYRSPSSTMLFDYASQYRLNIDAATAWQGELYLGSQAPHRYSARQALKMCHDNLAGSYIDTHCYVFTAESFFEILKTLLELELINFKVREFFATAQGEYEFFVLLEKVPAKTPAHTLLASLPSLPAARPYRQLQHELAHIQQQLQAAEAQTEALQTQLHQVYTSRSWWLTKPVRYFTRLWRQGIGRK